MQIRLIYFWFPATSTAVLLLRDAKHFASAVLILPWEYIARQRISRKFKMVEVFRMMLSAIILCLDLRVAQVVVKRQ